ncbi:glycosyltransferase [Microbulbifer sp. OS29]|uniref:Glycosyltransferase n=1 Tax=Microbulbifer okhotskensis TaxID=2926617 RepID=A0A9X2EQB3_9GAMM|nr:glycosyltransferase [Microbulbifer okhotskensis]MCO1335891.1 glycosyltransferase [Microbulbifer okhotskensis]
MLTNTYLPHVGGVAHSVSAFGDEYRKLGHKVLVIAPEFAQKITGEEHVLRIPAIQNFNGTDFSMALPFSGVLNEALDEFRPDIIHAHHPFLLGLTALRISRERELPLVFTHHTLYEHYTHNLLANSQVLKRFVVEVATRYANKATLVLAPSLSIVKLLRQRGVQTPIAEVPTGVRPEQYIHGCGDKIRRQFGIPPTAFVLGHLGRFGQEKNLIFLCRAVATFLQEQPAAHFILAGSGPMENELQQFFLDRNLISRVHMPGKVIGNARQDIYSAMDTFLFSSTTETQGLVLSEAMASGVPVIALEANGTRDMLRQCLNGRLVAKETLTDFTAAIRWLHELLPIHRRALIAEARSTAKDFSMQSCAQRALDLYLPLVRYSWPLDNSIYARCIRKGKLISTQWEIFEGFTEAAGAALNQSDRL